MCRCGGNQSQWTSGETVGSPCPHMERGVGHWPTKPELSRNLARWRRPPPQLAREGQAWAGLDVPLSRAPPRLQSRVKELHQSQSGSTDLERNFSWSGREMPPAILIAIVKYSRTSRNGPLP